MNIFEYLGFKKAYENSSTPGQGKSMAQYGYNARHGYQNYSNNESSKSTEKSTKTASTKETSSSSSDSKNKNSSNSNNVTVTVNPPSTSQTTNSGNMDWITEDYDSNTRYSQQNGEQLESFNAVKEVWNSDLGKIPVRVASRYLEDKLQKLVDQYNVKVAETVGQKRN